MKIIKRYKNRSLYDTGAKTSVSLSDIESFIKRGEDFRVVENTTGEDITGSTIIQILLNIERRTKKLGRMLTTIGKTTGRRTGQLASQILEHIRSILNLIES